jgi:hypothetical protein
MTRQDPDETATPVLPTLHATPTVFSGCCLALSAPLIAHLQSLLPPPPQLVLSIGSGFGLLEALLLDTRHVIGVEVKPSPNRHLPSTNHHTVHGSRFLDALAGEAAAWLFVYPRRVGLVDEYLAEYGSRAVQQIVWIGPQADWDDYKRCFRGWDVHAQAADDGGGRACELIAVARKGRD